jgi:hypothetical protein
MVDYVYICRDGENEELRYSIRSVVAHMPPGNIWVVGGKPKWYIGNHIPIKQSLPKERNAINNLKTICDSREISEDFVLMNDDFFVVKKVNTINYYHGGSLQDKMYEYEDLQPTSSYTRSLQETHRRLLRLGVENPLDYELHVPMPMTKDNLAIALRRKGLWRSTYGNLFEVGGAEITDVKVYQSGLMLSRSYDYSKLKYDYISSDDQSFERVLKDVLLDMFSEQSKYESPQLSRS